MGIDSDSIEEEVNAILGYEIGVGKEIADLEEQIREHYALMFEGWVERYSECGSRRQALLEIAGIWVRSVLGTNTIDAYRDVMMELIPLLRLSENVGKLILKNEPREDGHGDNDK